MTADGKRVRRRLLFAQDAVSFHARWIFLGGLSSDFFPFTACNGEGRPRLQVPVLLFSTLYECIFLLLCAPLASSHLFFITRAEEINHSDLPWKETKKMKYKSNYDIAQLRTLRRTLSYVGLSL